MPQVASKSSVVVNDAAPECRMPGQFCAGQHGPNRKGTCLGDDGAPIWKERWTPRGCHKDLVGVAVRNGFSDCGTTAEVFTPVSAYRDWILEHVGEARWCLETASGLQCA